MPRTVEGLRGLAWTTTEERDFIVSRCPQIGALLEVGTGSGVTACEVALIIPHLKVICVDDFRINDDPTMADGYENRKNDWMHNSKQVSGRMLLMEGPTDQVLPAMRGSRFGVVFIDAGHEEDQVLRDLKNVGPLVKRGGIILCHDWNSERWTGVRTAVDRFCREGGWRCEEGIGSICVLSKEGNLR